MKTKEQRRKEALARREFDLEFYSKQLDSIAKTTKKHVFIATVGDEKAMKVPREDGLKFAQRKFNAAGVDVENLQRKL